MASRRSPVLILLAVACSGSTSPPPRTTHAMVGTYDLVASFTTYTIPGPVVATVNASFVGTITIADTVVRDSTTGSYQFPDVRVSGTFCQAPSVCSSAQSWTTTTALAPGLPVLLDLAHVFRLEGPWSGTALSGSALYVQGTDARNQYSGTFIATHK